MNRPGFGQLLRTYRTRSGLTQERLADLAEVSVQAVNALEGGRRQFPRPSTVTRLAEAMGLENEERERLDAAARRPKGGEVRGVPRQLPPAIGDFIGRGDQLGELVELLRSPLAAAPGIVISAIGGMAGIGKTTLAVQAAHQVLEEFPDGQLYLNLRGGGDTPMATAEALDALLQTLGLSPAGTADDVPTTAARYRTALAGRRILVLLDDVASLEQVTPLMPGTPGAVVVITSRQPLSALPGARHLALEVLAEEEAFDLLREVVGAAAVDADREAALEVVRRCGLLPLAIRIAGGRARTSGLGELAARLVQEEGLQEVLTGPAAEVARSISLSLDHLASRPGPVDAGAAKSFPLLALFDGDRFPLRAAAKVLQVSLDDAEDLLERLVDVHLLETPAIHQYRMHDLVRETGRVLAASELSEQTIDDARRSELNCYLSMMWRWDELNGGPAKYTSREGSGWSAGARDVDDIDNAARWLEEELPNLVRLVRAAAVGDADNQRLAVQLALGMPAFATRLLRFADAREAVTAAARIPVDLPVDLEIGRFYQAGFLNGSLGFDHEAITWLERALPVARTGGTPTEVVACLLNLSHLSGRVGRVAEALPLAEEALAVVAEAGVERYEVGANVLIGYLAGLTGDLERQSASFDRALELMPERSALGPATVHRTLIGSSLGQAGRFKAAVSMLERVLDDARSLAAESVEAVALGELGKVLLAMGDLPRAVEVLEAGITIAARHPREHGEAPLLQTLGEVLTALGQPEQAQERWRRAIVLYERVADPRAQEVREVVVKGSGDRRSRRES